MNPAKALLDKAARQSGDSTLKLTIVEIVEEIDEIDVEQALAAINQQIEERQE